MFEGGEWKDISEAGTPLDPGGKGSGVCRDALFSSDCVN